MILGIIITIIIGLLITAYYLSKSEIDTFLDENNQPITSQDGLEDVITDEKTLHVKVHQKDRIKEEKIETTTITTGDFVEKEEVPKGVATLTDHIAKVIELNPNSKKRLNRRERNTVDKIVKEKNKK